MWMDPNQNGASAYSNWMSPGGGNTPSSNPFPQMPQGWQSPMTMPGQAQTPMQAQPLGQPPAPNGGWQTNVMSNANAGQPAPGSQQQQPGQSPFGSPQQILMGMARGMQAPVNGQVNPNVLQMPQSSPAGPLVGGNNQLAMARALMAQGGR